MPLPWSVCVCMDVCMCTGRKNMYINYLHIEIEQVSIISIRSTSQNYSLGPTPHHEHQREQVYSSAGAEHRFAAAYSSPSTWI